QAIARELVASAGADPAARLAALFDWLEALPPMPGPDAPDPHPGNQSSQLLFAPARANCTGSTNVTCALGRALGIPTRHVAGILTGEALQTHAVNELLLGNPRSWVRVEPQLGALVQHDYIVVLRIASPLDEGPASVDPERFATPGVPMYTLIEGLGERTRLTLDDVPEHFEGCPRCDNAAQRLGVLEDTSLERMQRLHARAAELWQRDRARWIATPRAGLPDARRQASAIARLDDLETLLQRLE
ncbi:MAG: transglutaminase domain-containing protein, partial [Deltaproteobacteria bacterium]|nr:transglutaminase domain-containing protein [Nannocystaceae bacterium]